MNPKYAAILKKTSIRRADPVYVFRVAKEGRGTERLEHRRSKAGGWNEYREMTTGCVFKTRAWYPHTTPIDALLYFISERVSLMAGCTIDRRRDALRAEVENAIRHIERCLSENRTAQERKDARMCGY